MLFLVFSVFGQSERKKHCFFVSVRKFRIGKIKTGAGKRPCFSGEIGFVVRLNFLDNQAYSLVFRPEFYVYSCLYRSQPM